MTHTIYFNPPDWPESLLLQLENGLPEHTDSLLRHTLGRFQETGTQQGLSCLSSLSHLSIYPHQLDAAQRVVFSLNGRAILADEVGLGKTIEAGLIMKEYLTRSLVKNVLILVPASLSGQWQQELGHHFGISSIIHRGKKEWRTAPVVIASLDLAKRAPMREEILRHHYDLVIVDEAHKLSNPRTQNYRFISELSKTYCLFLTATPVQNKLEDLYHLCALLRPDRFTCAATFRQAVEKGYHTTLLNTIMIRTSRENTDLTWTERKIHVHKIEQSPFERSLYEKIEDYYQSARQKNAHTFEQLSMLRLGCSSSIALLKALGKTEKKALLPELGIPSTVTPDQLETEKAKWIMNFIKKTPEKVIIYTHFRATQLYLSWYLKHHGISSVPFRGGFKKGKKKWMTDLFREKAQVLIATEAGAEGLNLQFCHKMIHADLPWNPMKLEQRIGRIHRIGQTHDVEIHYLLTKDTIEDRIWEVLQQKTAIFNRITGETKALLFPGKPDIQKYVHDTLTRSRSEEEIRLKLDVLEHELGREDS